MRKFNVYTAMIFVVALLTVLTVGLSAKSVTIGPDGYGTTVLPNGAKIIVNVDKSTSLSAGRILFGGGALTENADNNGISNLTINMLLKGNGRLNAAEITEQLDFLGATVSADCFRDYSAISFVCLTENLEKVLGIISDCLTSPTFPEDELVKLKGQVEGEIKATNDNQSAASNMLFWKTIYGPSGYGLPVLGTQESMSRAAVDGIRAHYKNYLGGRNMIVAVATDMDGDKLSTLLEKTLGPIKSDAAEVAPPMVGRQTDRNGFISYDRNQSYVYMGYVLDKLAPMEMTYLGLTNQVMGGPVGSRLWGLRQTEKLAYDVGTQVLPNRFVTVFRARIGTDTTKVRQALTSLNREWSRLKTDGVTEQEFSDARMNYKNSLMFGIDIKTNRANNMATFEYLGYGYRYYLDQLANINTASLAEVNDFVKAKLQDDRRYQSIVGKQ